MTVADTTVKYFNSAQTGAATQNGVAGSFITLLDQYLQDGFGSVTLTSLVVEDDVATVTVSGGHGFSMIGAGLLTGPVIVIAGATPSSLNREWRIATVPSSTEFTFVTSGISDQTATGTITAKWAPLGFTKVYSGTDKAAYQANDVSSTQIFLRVDDSNAQYAILRMYETMSDVDTGTACSPNMYYYKSMTADSTARAYRFIGDHCAFYIIATSHTSNANYASLFFGDLAGPFSPTDAYHCALIGATSIPTGNTVHNLSTKAINGKYIARPCTQASGYVQFALRSIAGTSYLSEIGTDAIPGLAGNLYVAAPVLCVDNSPVDTPRGWMPGLMEVAVTSSNYVLTTTYLTNDGGDIIICNITSNYYIGFEVYLPWR